MPRKKQEKIQGRKVKKNVLYIILGVILLTFTVFYTLSKVSKNKNYYTVTEDSINISTDVEAYVIKKEKIIDTDTSKSTIPVAKEGTRVAKGDTIAIYKNSSYDSYLKKIEELDLEISKALSELPAVYSNDISVIEEQIESMIKEIKNSTSSYIQMQENKNKLNDLTYKRNLLISNLSPNGSIVKELIANRDKIVEESNNSSDNIKATTSGVIMYTLDEFENAYNYDDVLNFENETLTEMIYKINNMKKNKSGIKIIDNYNAYILIKIKKSDNDQYISKQRKYTLKINSNNEEITGEIVRFTSDDVYNYIIFYISNGLENLIDTRMKSINITWSQKTGLKIPKNAVKEDENGKYVEVIKYGDYKKIYIKEIISNDTNVIVKSVENAKPALSQYDRIITE